MPAGRDAIAIDVAVAGDAEHIMQDKFGLKWPSWLPSNYYLGP
jgi:hypothetical protein